MRFSGIAVLTAASYPAFAVSQFSIWRFPSPKILCAHTRIQLQANRQASIIYGNASKTCEKAPESFF